MVQTTPTSIGGQRGQIGGQLLQELEALNEALYQAGQRKSDVVVPPSPRRLSRRETMPARLESELYTQSEALVPLGSLLRSSLPRPPLPAKDTAASQVNTGRKPETWHVESEKVGNESAGRLQQWHSQGFEKTMPEVGNFPEWVEDSVDFSQKLEAPAEKKKGLWGWKPFRAFALMGQQKFNCLFTVHVHGIEGLPPSLNGLRLGVHFAKKDGTGVQTMPSRVFQGHAEFQETLNLRCSLHGAKIGAKGIKWETKQFILSVIALDIDELVLGRHILELTRLLTETIEDDEEKQDIWTTSFKLTGKAQGATLIMTFGCEIQSKDSQNLSGTSSFRFGESPVLRAVRSFNSLPNSGHATPSRYASEAHHSPAMSEPSGEYHSMEHLSLTDINHESPYSAVKGSMHSDPQDAKCQLYVQSGSLLAPRTPMHAKEGPFEVAKNHRYDNIDAGGEEEAEDDDLEFTVVVQGVEVGMIVDNVSSRGYDAFEPEDESDSEKKHGAESVRVLTQEKDHGDVSQEMEDHFEENKEEVSKDSWEVFIDEKEESPGSAGDDIIVEELEKRVIDPKNSGTQSVNFSVVKHLPRSVDEELEMQVLLAALAEQERESEVEECADTTKYLEYFQRRDLRGGASSYSQDPTSIDQENEHVLDLPDDMTEEELFSLLPSEVESDWNSDKRVAQSKVPESDDEFDPVAGEFLSLLVNEAQPAPVALTSDSEADSPCAVLLKQFEKEAMIESGLGLNMEMPNSLSYVEHSGVPDFHLDDFPIDSSDDAGPTNEPHNLTTQQHNVTEDFNNLGWCSEEDVEMASIMEAAESELQKATQTMRSKTRAKMLEDAETEALMQEWGLNKKMFEASSPKSLYADDTGDPYAMVAFDVPSLGFGLGSVVQIRDGGTLRSMNPLNFQATSGSNLVMQVSKPVVVPMDMGASCLDILRRMAAAGIDGMTDQAMLAMPLDDITGKSVEQVASEGFAAFRGNYQERGQHGYAAIEGGQAPLSLEYTQDSHSSLGTFTSQGGLSLATSGGRANMHKSNPNLGDDTLLSLEDLAPMAIAKIEALALEGLKIQSDIAEQEAPYVVDPLLSQERPAKEGCSSTRQSGGKSLERVTSMRLLDGGSAEGSGNSGDGFSMAVSLDEWMRLDASVIDENDTNENTMALLATHQATHGDIVSSKQQSSNWGKQGRKQKEDGTNEKARLMGDTVTLAMLLQLRDPLRDYEPVGAPMMALVQAERVAVPPMPKLRLGRRISLKGNNEGYDDESGAPSQPQFKLLNVTVSGLKTSPETASDKKKQIGWGTQKQQQSGSRWLVASGMAKLTKHSILTSKSNAITYPATNKSTSSVSKSDSLWSISTKIGSKWGAPAVSKTRNPDVAMSKTGWLGRKT